uniref:Uncharacterized protein n=1 Tax=Anopheles stephensi TaxID=30069 RepID=A0A182YPA7_ANOST
MSLEETKDVMAATRQLTALEGAIQGLLNEARSGKVNPAMASVKLDILQSLWNDGNKALLKLEELQGPQPPLFATIMEAYTITKFELKRIGLAKAPASPQFDVTLAPGPSRSDHLPRIERFYKKRVAFLGHLKNVIDMPKMTKASFTGLMRIIDVVETSISSARQIAGESGTKPTVVEDGLLVQLVLGKLDDDTITRATSRLDAQIIPTWNSYVKSWTGCQAKSTTSRTGNTALRSSNATRPSYKGVSILHGQEVTRHCYACDKLGHVGTLCPELRVRSAFERVNLIMGKGKCVNCFSGQHPTTQCPSEKQRQVCKKKHHTIAAC